MNMSEKINIVIDLLKREYNDIWFDIFLMLEDDNRSKSAIYKKANRCIELDKRAEALDTVIKLLELLNKEVYK